MYESAKLFRFNVLLLGVLIPLVSGCSSIRWEHSHRAGLKKAFEQGRRAVIQFYSLNSDCRQMDQEVFTNDDVQKLMKEFVPIRLDYHLNGKLARQYGVQQVPTFIILRPDVFNMTVAGSQAGKMEADTFRHFLIKHRYN